MSRKMECYIKAWRKIPPNYFFPWTWSFQVILYLIIQNAFWNQRKSGSSLISLHSNDVFYQGEMYFTMRLSCQEWFQLSIHSVIDDKWTVVVILILQIVKRGGCQKNTGLTNVWVPHKYLKHSLQCCLSLQSMDWEMGFSHIGNRGNEE